MYQIVPKGEILFKPIATDGFIKKNKFFVRIEMSPVFLHLKKNNFSMVQPNKYMHQIH